MQTNRKNEKNYESVRKPTDERKTSDEKQEKGEIELWN